MAVAVAAAVVYEIVFEIESFCKQRFWLFGSSSWSWGVRAVAEGSALAWTDRVLWAWLSRLWNDWRSGLLIVKPETVIAWHILAGVLLVFIESC